MKSLQETIQEGYKKYIKKMEEFEVEEKLKESCEHKYSLYQKVHPFAYFYCEKCLLMKKINVNYM